MDFIIEFIIDFFADLVTDGAQEVVNEKRIPKGIRIFALVVLTLVYMAVFALFVWVFVQCEEWLVRCFSAGMVILIMALVVKSWHKLIKGR